MEITLTLIVIAVLSYLIGSFPTAVLISRKFFGFDIRKKGSGNMGSTNAFRVLGKKWGILTQVIDTLKGVLAVVVVAGILGKEIALPGSYYFEDQTIIKIMAGLCAVLGHVFSIFVGFKGGKGINTAAGVLIGLSPIDFGVSAFFFFLAVSFSGYISLGSIVGAFIFPASLIFRYNVLGDDISDYQTLVWFAVGLFLLIVYTHRSNIARLLKGTENKFSKLQIFRFKKSVHH